MWPSANEKRGQKSHWSANDTLGMRKNRPNIAMSNGGSFCAVWAGCPCEAERPNMIILSWAAETQKYGDTGTLQCALCSTLQKSADMQADSI